MLGIILIDYKLITIKFYLKNILVNLFIIDMSKYTIVIY